MRKLEYFRRVTLKLDDRELEFEGWDIEAIIKEVKMQLKFELLELDWYNEELKQIQNCPRLMLPRYIKANCLKLTLKRKHIEVEPKDIEEYHGKKVKIIIIVDLIETREYKPIKAVLKPLNGITPQQALDEIRAYLDDVRTEGLENKKCYIDDNLLNAIDRLQVLINEAK